MKTACMHQCHGTCGKVSLLPQSDAVSNRGNAYMPLVSIHKPNDANVAMTDKPSLLLHFAFRAMFDQRISLALYKLHIQFGCMLNVGLLLHLSLPSSELQ